MAIDLLNLSPTVVSRDLRGKYVLLYAKPKTGKTSFCVQAPKNLLVAFERGYNAHAGIMAQPIEKWSEFKQLLRQLHNDAVKEKFYTISIDTATIAYQKCVEYICIQNGVSKIGDIPYGAGYAAVKQEFENSLREITMLGYGLILTAHVATRTEMVADGSEVEFLAPDLDKRAYSIINGLVDVIGYISNDFDAEGNSHRYLYTHATPTIMAGTRFPALSKKIPFSYQNFADELAKAIEQAGGEGQIIDAPIELVTNAPDFQELREEAKQLWTQLIEENEDNAAIILHKLEQAFGKPTKLSEITPAQVDLLELAVIDMRDMVKK